MLQTHTLMINHPHDADRIIEFIRVTFGNAHKQTAVIALSGGIDSTLSLMLSAKALGPGNVHAFHLPAKGSHPVHLEDARTVVQAAGISEDHFHLLPIGSIIQKSWRIINHHTTHPPTEVNARETQKIRLANLAARTRMMVIYDQAKKLDALVVGTENYSEHLLGYFTRFGDEASDVEPIRHLYKTQVIDLAKAIGVPPSIIDKPPSADLWTGQTDAKELGFSYQDADPILSLIDQGKTPNEIVTLGFPQPLVKAVSHQLTSTSFKHLVPYKL